MGSHIEILVVQDSLKTERISDVVAVVQQLMRWFKRRRNAKKLLYSVSDYLQRSPVPTEVDESDDEGEGLPLLGDPPVEGSAESDDSDAESESEAPVHRNIFEEGILPDGQRRRAADGVAWATIAAQFGALPDVADAVIDETLDNEERDDESVDAGDQARPTPQSDRGPYGKRWVLRWM